jgi:hypothetical protein
MTARYVSNARTRQELRREFLSDLARRLDALDKRLKVSHSAVESSRIAYARTELLDLQDFWREVELATENLDAE